jgi:Fe2+ or Zn2+ uptake regulation protein
MTADAIMQAFDSVGLRHTRPRQIIAHRLAEHAAMRTDFATDDLWQQLQQVDPRLGRATLFRAVDVLVDLGVLDRIEIGDGTRRYRVCDPGHHHHLICTNCHRIQEIDVCLPEAELTQAAERAGFAVDRHALELYGRCANCR